MVHAAPHASASGPDPKGAPEGQSYASSYHAPVLAKEVVKHLITDPSGTYVDATLGGGGHARALLDALEDDAFVLGIDRDEQALEFARERLEDEQQAGRFRAVRGNFEYLPDILDQVDVAEVDGILLDLGVSSHQIDEPGRGFSFMADGPLDMRMDQREGFTAKDIVNDWSQDELKDLFKELGEERRAGWIARGIVQERPLETTAELASVVRHTVPEREATKALARIFQALRIAVNQELSALEAVLESSLDVLVSEGRMAVISYHSLEDRRVKRFFRYGNFENKPIRDFYGNLITPWERVVDGPLRASEEEVEVNSRARSARLRVAALREDYDPEAEHRPPPPH